MVAWGSPKAGSEFYAMIPVGALRMCSLVMVSVLLRFERTALPRELSHEKQGVTIQGCYYSNWNWNPHGCPNVREMLERTKQLLACFRDSCFLDQGRDWTRALAILLPSISSPPCPTTNDGRENAG